MTAAIDLQRVAELARLPKCDLVRRLRAVGGIGGAQPLEKWSNHDLAATLLRAEQIAGVE